MPLEVRELVIKAVIGEGQEAQSNTSSSSSGSPDQNAIIQSCVEKVLEIIQKNQER